MEKSQRNNENVITIKKIADNLKRYWWVLVLSLVFAILFIVYSTKNGNELQEKNYKVNALLCLQSVSEEEVTSESEFATALERSNRILDNNLMNQDGAYVVNMLNTLLDSKNVRKEICSELGGKETEDYLSEVQLKFVANSRLIECSVEMVDVESAVSLLNVTTEVLCARINELIKNECLVIVEKADLSNYEENDEENLFFSIKNIFIIFLCLCIGLFIILLLILADNRVREPYEIEDVSSLVFWGKVRKNKYFDMDIKKIEAIILRKKAEERFRKLYFVTLDNAQHYKETFDRIYRQINNEQNEDKIKFIFGLSEGIQEIENISDEDRMILLIKANEDKITDIERALIWFRAMKLNVEGYVLAE